MKQLSFVDEESRIVTCSLTCVLFLHAALVGVQAWRNAPNLDEVGHLPAGLSHWIFGNFDLYRVNPPLVRMIATAPLLPFHPQTDWSQYHPAARARAEFDVGVSFLRANGAESFKYFTLARYMLIPVSMMGALACYAWARDLFGRPSGLVAATLWCFCPNMIAWGASITPDAAAAAFGVLASWRLRRWLNRPSWTNVGLAGVCLGLAELTKTTWILLFVLWPIAWLCWRFSERESRSPQPSLGQLCCVLVLAVYLINLGYGFENSFWELRRFNFISETLGGAGAHECDGNRFRDSWIGRLPVPLPGNYVRGIDVQKYDFEVGKWSYLRGEQKYGGWIYYYAYAMLIKTPLGFLAVCLIALILSLINRRYRLTFADEMQVIIPAVAVFALVSWQTGFNRYLRYALPAYPFLYIFASRIALCFGGPNRSLKGAVLVLLSVGITSSLAIAPHSMSYFNLGVGGPLGGKSHLLDANIDWGQDLLRLRDWVAGHPEATPFHARIFSLVELETTGIRARPIPSQSPSNASPLTPGWYAISVNELMGYRHDGKQDPQCMWFQRMEPIAMVGYSIYVYHVTVKDLSVMTPDPRKLKH